MDYESKIGPYVDGELSADERKDLEAHLETHPELREVAIEFRTLDRLLSAQSAPPPASNADWEKMLTAVKRRTASGDSPTSERPRHRGSAISMRWRWRWLAPLAAAMLIVGFWGLTMLPPDQGAPPKMSPSGEIGHKSDAQNSSNTPSPTDAMTPPGKERAKFAEGDGPAFDDEVLEVESQREADSESTDKF